MPVELLEVEANELIFTVRTAGPATGLPVLLLHGFPQTSICFADQLAALDAAGYRALAPDQRGYSTGARPAGVKAYALTNLVDDVFALADGLGMDRFDLVGHDWGGMVAWTAAARHPSRIRTLTSISTPHPEALGALLREGDDDQAGRLAYVAVFRQRDVPEQLLLGEDGSGDGLRRLFSASGLDDHRAGPYVEAMRAPGALTAALNWYRATDLEVAGRSGDLVVTAPTMYIWSTEDIAFGRKAAEATGERVSGPYRFEVLEGVSHWIPDTAADQLNRLLLDHLGSVA